MNPLKSDITTELDRAAFPLADFLHPHAGSAGGLPRIHNSDLRLPFHEFPRVLIAVEYGVMPIDQMMVTVTRR